MTKAEKIQQRKELHRVRYATDLAYRQRILANNARRRQRVRSDPELKKKDREYRAKYHLTNIEDVKSKRLLRMYGVDMAWFENTLAIQGRRCAICHTDEPVKPGWHVDHAHNSGITRGILCVKCNLLLGYANDSVETLRRAIAYLEKHSVVSGQGE